MNDTFWMSDGPSEKKSTFFQMATLIAICIYALSLYVGYVNSALLNLQGLSLYAMVGLMLIVVIQRGSIRINQYLVWYGIFILAALVSCLYSDNRSKSLSSVYGLVVVWIFALAINAVITRMAHIEMIFASLIIGSVLLTVYLSVTGQFQAFDDTGSRFGEELTGNANVFAAVYMIAASASVYFLYCSKTLRNKLICIGALALQIYALTVSGGRKYFLFPFILMYIMSLQKKDKKHRTHFIRVTLFAAVLVIAVYYLLMNVEFLYESIGYRFEDLIEYTTGQSSEVEGGTIIREKMIKKGLELWAQSPIIGHGLNSFASIGGFGVYSHNNFVEMLCNHGIIGFVLYYGFYIYALVALIKSSKNDTMKHFLIGFILCLFIYEYGAIAYNTLVTQMFLMFAVIYGRLSARRSEQPDVIETE